MVNLVPTRMAGVIMTVGLVAMAGTNFAFAQQPSCGEQAYGYIGCTPKETAQMYGAILVGGVVALALGFGVAGRKFHTVS